MVVDGSPSPIHSPAAIHPPYQPGIYLYNIGPKKGPHTQEKEKRAWARPGAKKKNPLHHISHILFFLIPPQRKKRAPSSSQHEEYLHTHFSPICVDSRISWLWLALAGPGRLVLYRFVRKIPEFSELNATTTQSSFL